MSPVKTYTGHCHCGAVRFRITTEEITRGMRCNCSICVRKGVVMSVPYFSPQEIQVEGREALTLYQWGDRMVNNWFCRTCGIHPFHDVTEKTGHYRVNLGCIDGLDVLSLPIELVDGKAF